MLATCLQRMRTRLSTDSPSHACTAVRAVCPAGKGMATAPTLTLDLICATCPTGQFKPVSGNTGRTLWQQCAIGRS